MYSFLTEVLFIQKTSCISNMLPFSKKVKVISSLVLRCVLTVLSTGSCDECQKLSTNACFAAKNCTASKMFSGRTKYILLKQDIPFAQHYFNAVLHYYTIRNCEFVYRDVKEHRNT